MVITVSTPFDVDQLATLFHGLHLGPMEHGGGIFEMSISYEVTRIQANGLAPPTGEG